MSYRYWLLLTCCLLAGCIQRKDAMLSDSEKSKIMDDIRSQIAALSLGAESLNTSSAFRLYARSPEFRSISMDGSLTDYALFFNNSDDFFKSCSSLKFVNIQDEFKFLTSDFVVYSWIYQAKAVLKNGDRYDFEKVGATFLFKRVDENWTTMYLHESGLPPIITAAR